MPMMVVVVIVSMVMVVVMVVIVTLVRRTREDRQNRQGDDGREGTDEHGVGLRFGDVAQTLDGCQIVLRSVKGSIVHGLSRASWSK